MHVCYTVVIDNPQEFRLFDTIDCLRLLIMVYQNDSFRTCVDEVGRG